MALIVLDSSAVLALMLSEPGAKEVENVIADSLISVVNESEVMSRLVWGGESAERAEEIVRALPYEVADLDRLKALQAAAFWKPTRAQGLSLGDRCCLALAEANGLPVLTGDTSWRDVAVGIEVRLLAGRRHR
jgi:ribonuclease VapC